MAQIVESNLWQIYLSQQSLEPPQEIAWPQRSTARAGENEIIFFPATLRPLPILRGAATYTTHLSGMGRSKKQTLQITLTTCRVASSAPKMGTLEPAAMPPEGHGKLAKYQLLSGLGSTPPALIEHMIVYVQSSSNNSK
jgi:hypothetical protein